MISYVEARRIVAEVALRTQGGRAPAHENVALAAALGRVLAAPLDADRDAPPFHRSTRDGFAVRAADVANVPATLALVGEIRAGAEFTGAVRPGECVQIMTGAAVPSGADAVAMIEHTEPQGGAVVVTRSVAAGANVVPRGSEAKAGDALLAA